MSNKMKIIIGSVSLALVIVIIAITLSLYFVLRSKGPFSGTVTEEGTGAPVANVMVSDGRNVVKTDSEGKFTLDGYNKSRFVTVTVPSEYNTNDFYIPVDKNTKSYDFKLQKLENVDYSNGHSFLQVSDTEIGIGGVGEWINHVQGLVDELKPSFLIHTGDICYEAGLWTHYSGMNSEKMGIPVRYVIGNHDYVKWGKYGEALFERIYGPVWYSFDVANVHYIVTPFQTGADEPSGYDKNDRWKWLANDLANVDPNKKIVMFNHTTPPSEDYVISYDNKQIDLKEHNLIAWIFGHYHDNFVNFTDNEILAISTARPDAGGIDSSVSGTRYISVSPEGKMSTKMYYYNFDADKAQRPEDVIWSNEDLKGNVLFADTLLIDGVVYVATADDDYPRECGVYAIDANTGATLWFYKTVNSVKNNMVVTADGRLIAQDAAGNVICLDTKDNGKVLWETTVEYGNSMGVSSGIVTDGTNVYVGCAAYITALKVSDGSKVWEKSRNKGESSPAEFVLAGDRLLVSSHWDALLALDKNTGKVLWELKDEDIRFRSSTPALIDENTALIADDDVVMIVDLNKGKVTSKKIYSDIRFNVSSQPYIKDGVAYVGTANKGVYAFSLDTLEIKWNFMTERSLVYTAPYSSGKSATVESSFAVKDGNLIFGANDGYVYKVNMVTGELVNKVNIYAPILGKVALDGDSVIVSDFAGRVYKLNI